MGEPGWAVTVPTGYVVGGWRVTAALATGAWGSVYAAERTTGAATDHAPDEVALKFLPGRALSPAQRAVVGDLAEREVAFTTTVRARHLVRTFAVLDVDDPEMPAVDGCTVVVMERAAASLRELIAAATPERPVPGAVQLLHALAEALDDVHGGSWVHGDITPANVLVMPEGTLRLADFGLSAELDGTHAYVPHLGSVDHVPPEWWAAGLDVRGVQARPASDVWAFGVVAHELLTGGRHPFPGAHPRARANAVREYAAAGPGPHLDPNLGAGWRVLVLDCLALDPDARSRLACGLADRVTALTDEPVQALEEAPAGTGSSRRRWAVAGGLAAAAAASVLIATMLGNDPDSDPPSAGGEPEAGEVLAGDEALPAGELRPDADVPEEYRQLVTDAAHRCPKESVTPALVAAMLEVESGFDADARSPDTNEYGIALWTPQYFRQWVPVERGVSASVFDAEASTFALVTYLCAIGPRLHGLDGTDPGLLAAAYRGGSDNVVAANGVPTSVRDYVADVEQTMRSYATD